MNIRQILLLGLASIAGVFSHVRGADFVWHGGGDGVSWIDPLNWDQAAVPGPADHAILDVPGEVTVVVGGPLSVGSFVNHERLVMLGSGSTGMGSLSVFNGAENHGVIALDSIDGAWSSGYFSGATLTNRAGGVIEVKAGAGGLRYLSTSIENHGTIRSDDGVFVEADATGLAFRQLGGSVQAVMGWSGGSFDFVDGTVGGFLMLRNTAVTVHETADAGSLLVITSNNGSTLSGHIPEGVEIWVRGSNYGGHTSVAVQDGTLNDGRIRLESGDVDYVSNLTIAGVLTNGPTGVIDSQVGTGGDRVISGTLVNQGLVDATAYYVTYYGTYELAAGRVLGAVNFASVTLRQTASPSVSNVLRLRGTTTLVTDNLPNVELWINGGGWLGTGVLTAPGGWVNRGVIRLESSEADYVSMVNGTGVLTNDAAGLIHCKLGTGGPRRLDLSVDNRGTIRTEAGVFLESDGTGRVFRQLGGSMEAAMGWSGGTFEFVDGLIGGFLMLRNTAVTVHETADAGSLLVITSNNGSTLSGHIPEGVEIWVRGSNYGGHTSVAVQDGTLNDGRIRLESGDVDYVSNLTIAGVLTNGPTGVIDSQVGTGGDRVISGTLVNQGLVDATAYYVTYYGTYELAAGRVLGAVNFASVTLRQTASPSVSNVLRLRGTTTLVTDNLPNVELWINGGGWLGTGVLTAPGGWVNRGVIRLESSEADYVSMVSGAGTLTNEASGMIHFKLGTGGPRRLDVSVDNRGTIRTEAGVFLESDGTGRVFRQLGGSMEAAMGWSGGTFEFVDGLIGGFLMVRNTAVTVHETADAGSLLVITSNNGSTLSGHIPEGVEIWVRGSNYGGHTSVAVQDGTLNDGRIRLESGDLDYVSNLTIAGVLTNGPTGVIDSQVGTGGDRVISGTLVNQGLLDATAYFISYYGTYEVAGGRVLGAVNFFSVAVRMTASPSELTTLRLVGSSTLLTDNLPNVELWVNGSDMGSTGTLNVNSGLVNRGIIRVASSEQGYVSQIAGTGPLTNGPTGRITFQSGSGGPRSLWVSVVNQGLFQVEGGVGLVGSGADGRTFTQEAGSLEVAGGAWFTWDGGLLRHTGGTTSGEVFVRNGSIEVGSGAGMGWLTAMGSTSLELMESPLVTVQVRGSDFGGHTTMGVRDGLVNRGTIVMQSTEQGYTSSIQGVGTLVNAAGALIVANGGSGGPRRLDVSVDNRGTIRTEAGVFLESDGTGRLFRQLGGSLEAAMGWSGGTFEFVDGLIGGFLMVRSGAVAVEGTADPGSVLILTGGGASLSGHVPEGVEIWVRGSNYGGHTSVAVQDGTLNDGRIRLEAADQGYSSNLVLSGVLTNGPTGVIDSQVGSGGDRVISGTLVNQGLLDATPFFITYYGTYEVAGGRAVGAVNFFHVTVRQTASPALPNTLRLMGDSTLLTDNLANVELWVNGSGPGGTATLSVVDGAVNQGTLRAESTDGGYVSQIISAGTLRNATAGQMRFAAGAGGPRSFTGQLLNAGMVTVDPGMLLTVVGPTFDNLEGGLVTGQGSYDVTFTLFRNAGVISPAGGSLTFTGNVQMETGGVVELAVAGPQAYFEHEQVFVNGLANLRGSLRVALAPEYHPAAGTELLLISATFRFGIFQTLQHPGTTTVMSAVYDSTSVRLLVDNGAPIAVEDVIERKRGAGIKIRPARLLLNDQDPEGQALTVVSVGATSASGGSVVMEEGWIIYSPLPGAPLFDSFTYVVRDSAGAETPGQVTLVEAGVDGQPSRNISGISVPEGGPAMVRGHGIPGRTYRIDVKSQLSDPDWQPLGSIQAGPDGTWNLPDEAASAHETRFYRTVEL